MPSPFPGMNPYLEHPRVWPEFHKWLVTLIAETLNPLLRPKYRVAIEERVYQSWAEDSLLVGIPDNAVMQSSKGKFPDASPDNSSAVALATPPPQPVKVTLPAPETTREWYLEVRTVGTDEVVTAIELLSPSNKRPGAGRVSYEAKRQLILGSLTHLIEIDLLRQGPPMPIARNGILSHYRLLVSRSESRPQADLYAFNLPDAIPTIPLPLKAGDAEPFLDLQALLQVAYDRGSYDLILDYDRNPVPALAPNDLTWVEAQLVEQGFRS